MLRESFERKNWDRGIDVPDRAPEQIGGSGLPAGRARRESYKKGNVALKSAPERHIDRAAWIFFKKCVTRCRDDPDDLNRFARFDFTAKICTHSETSAAAAFRARRLVAGKLDLLSEGVAFRPEFFREHVVDNRDRRTARLRRFRFRECAATQD